MQLKLLVMDTGRVTQQRVPRHGHLQACVGWPKRCPTFRDPFCSLLILRSPQVLC